MPKGKLFFSKWIVCNLRPFFRVRAFECRREMCSKFVVLLGMSEPTVLCCVPAMFSELPLPVVAALADGPSQLQPSVDLRRLYCDKKKLGFPKWCQDHIIHLPPGTFRAQSVKNEMNLPYAFLYVRAKDKCHRILVSWNFSSDRKFQKFREISILCYKGRKCAILGEGKLSSISHAVKVSTKINCIACVA